MAKTEDSNVIKRNILAARKLLIWFTGLMDQQQIVYHLEGGTLLGIVRDKDLLPWDDDMDISIPENQLNSVRRLWVKLLFLGYRLTVRKSRKALGPFSVGDIYVLRIKPVKGYMIQWFWPKYKNVVIDIFVKKSDAQFTYWQAKDKLMRVENKYYESFDRIDFFGASLKTPNHYRDYLTQKYGDWTVPIKEWDCSAHELTIVK